MENNTDEKNLIINEIDSEINNEKEDYEDNRPSIELPKLNIIDFFFNNLYFRNKCKSKNQDIILICNEIVLKYFSIDYILYNQLKLENLLKDYKWNNPRLKSIKNNKLINQLNNYLIVI